MFKDIMTIIKSMWRGLLGFFIKENQHHLLKESLVEGRQNLQTLKNEKSTIKAKRDYEQTQLDSVLVKIENYTNDLAATNDPKQEEGIANAILDLQEKEALHLETIDSFNSILKELETKIADYSSDIQTFAHDVTKLEVQSNINKTRKELNNLTDSSTLDSLGSKIEEAKKQVFIDGATERDKEDTVDAGIKRSNRSAKMEQLLAAKRAKNDRVQ